jgi:hypothetical protein
MKAPHLLYAVVATTASFSCVADPASLAAPGTLQWSGTITTVATLANGGTSVATQPFDVVRYFAAEGVRLPTTRSNSVTGAGYVDNTPPRPPPPTGVDPRVGSVTLKVDNGVQTRTTTYNRSVSNDPNGVDGVDDGPWVTGPETITDDPSAGGNYGGCNSKTSGGAGCDSPF